jgi:hypothetical protein
MRMLHENSVMIHWRPVGNILERETWFEALLFYNSAEQQQESETLIITVVEEGRGKWGGERGGTGVSHCLKLHKLKS